MLKEKVAGLFFSILLLVAFSPFGFAQEKIEGTVIKTNLISCSLVPGKVGTCEGTFVLESKGNEKARQTTIKVTRDTTLKTGDEKLFLFQLQGGLVTVSFVTEKGEKVAQSVLMKSQKQ